MGLQKVQEVMYNHPVSININDYATHARQLMRDYHMTLPVVDDNKTGNIFRMVKSAYVLNMK